MTDAIDPLGDVLALLEAPAIALSSDLRVVAHNEGWVHAVELGWVPEDWRDELHAQPAMRSRSEWARRISVLASVVLHTPGADVHDVYAVRLSRIRARARVVHRREGGVVVLTLVELVGDAPAFGLDELVDRIPTGLVIRDGTRLMVNRAVEIMTGHPRGELATVSAWCERVLRLDPPAARALRDEALDDEPPSPRTHVVETPSGARRVLEITRRRHQDGEVWLVTDVTERSQLEVARGRLELALKRANEDFASTFDAIADAIVVLDASGRLVQLNREARGQLGGESACVGRPLASIATQPPWSTVAVLLETQCAFEREVIDARTQRAWLVTACAVDERDPQGRRVVVARDVSAALALQRAAGEQHALAIMGALVGGVAHEVRNPLFGISAMLDLFEVELGRNPEFTQYVAALRSQVERLSSLMHDLLEYGRPVQSDLAPTAVVDVVDDAVAACRLLAQSLDVRIATHVSHDLPLVAVDRLRVGQALRNLLENALQHAPRGSSVRVTAWPAGDLAHDTIDIAVRDHGPGFRPSDLPRIFDPFFTRRRGGTGLGLAIAQRVVTDHGGEVQASNADDGGAVVTIRLPVARVMVRDDRHA